MKGKSTIKSQKLLDEILYLRESRGLPLQRISEIIGQPKSVVKVALQRTRKRRKASVNSIMHE